MPSENLEKTVFLNHSSQRNRMEDSFNHIRTSHLVNVEDELANLRKKMTTAACHEEAKKWK